MPRAPGIVLTEHELTVPLDHDRPDGEQITVFAREVAALDGADRPYLVYLQGGSGSLKQSILPDGSPVIIEVIEFPNGVQRAFDGDFFRLSCPVKATED